MNGVKLPFCGTNPLIVLLDSYCMSSYIYNTNMANTKKVKKVYRRTNSQMRRDEARMRREDSQQRSQMNSFLRRKIVDPIQELWERVKARDKYASLCKPLDDAFLVCGQGELDYAAHCVKRRNELSET